MFFPLVPTQFTLPRKLPLGQFPLRKFSPRKLPPEQFPVDNTHSGQFQILWWAIVHGWKLFES